MLSTINQALNYINSTVDLYISRYLYFCLLKPLGCTLFLVTHPHNS